MTSISKGNRKAGPWLKPMAKTQLSPKAEFIHYTLNTKAPLTKQWNEVRGKDRLGFLGLELEIRVEWPFRFMLTSDNTRPRNWRNSIISRYWHKQWSILTSGNGLLRDKQITSKNSYTHRKKYVSGLFVKKCCSAWIPASQICFL